MLMQILLGVLLALCALIVAAVRYAIVFPRQGLRGPLPPMPPDASARVAVLRRHVAKVASRPHSTAFLPELEAAARYIEAELSSYGLAPIAHHYTVDGIEVRNIEVVLEPATSRPGSACIVIGAHYDAPDDFCGANDNGTGVAALLEIARVMAKTPPKVTRLRLVFFVNEEHPYGKTPQMGSWQYANVLTQMGERVRGMIALETLGFFSDEPGSQRFPKPFDVVYPDTGNFVAFVALPGARRFLHDSIKAFRRSGLFPSIGGLAPGFLEGIDMSDHWSFHQFGYPALMITDTAPFRNPHYHQPTDTPENVDYESLARITMALVAMTRQLVD